MRVGGPPSAMSAACAAEWAKELKGVGVYPGKCHSEHFARESPVPRQGGCCKCMALGHPAPSASKDAARVPLGARVMLRQPGRAADSGGQGVRRPNGRARGDRVCEPPCRVALVRNFVRLLRNRIRAWMTLHSTLGNAPLAVETGRLFFETCASDNQMPANVSPWRCWGMCPHSCPGKAFQESG